MGQISIDWVETAAGGSLGSIWEKHWCIKTLDRGEGRHQTPGNTASRKMCGGERPNYERLCYSPGDDRSIPGCSRLRLGLQGLQGIRDGGGRHSSRWIRATNSSFGHIGQITTHWIDRRKRIDRRRCVRRETKWQRRDDGLFECSLVASASIALSSLAPWRGLRGFDTIHQRRGNLEVATPGKPWFDLPTVKSSPNTIFRRPPPPFHFDRPRPIPGQAKAPSDFSPPPPVSSNERRFY